MRRTRESPTPFLNVASVIGVDLGGTKMAVARYDAVSLKMQEEQRFDTHAADGMEHVLLDLLMGIESLKASDTTGVGIGVPGLVKHPAGEIVTMPNIAGTEYFPLQMRLEERLKLKVRVDNDANCFALAEALFGAGKGHDVVCGITMGTGVGGGIVINGKLFRGSHGFAAEIGHMLLMPGKPPYESNGSTEPVLSKAEGLTTSMRGGVEQFLSGSAMGKRCSAAKRPEDYLEGEVCSFLQPEVLKEVAWLVTNLAHLLDPSIIIFGGSAGMALKSHLKEIEAELKKWMLPETPLPEIAIASLKDSATRGAALLVQ